MLSVDTVPKIATDASAIPGLDKGEDLSNKLRIISHLSNRELAKNKQLLSVLNGDNVKEHMFQWHEKDPGESPNLDMNFDSISNTFLKCYIAKEEYNRQMFIWEIKMEI